jgi:drug/metabolite transporter (DMT)-like permease
MVVGSMGLLASSIAAFIICRVLRLVDSTLHITPTNYCLRMLPVGAVMAVTIWTGNLVYLYLTVAFTQMLKAASPVLTMLAAFCVKLESPNLQIITSVIIITSGLVLASYGEINFNPFGVAIMLTSEVSEATRLVMTELLLRKYSLGPFDGLLYLVGVGVPGM